MLLKNLLPNSDRLTPAQTAYVKNRASLDFVVYNRVTNQPLLAIEVDGFAFHENKPTQLARDALKNEILRVHDLPLLRLPTTGSGEQQRILDALISAESHWARRSAPGGTVPRSVFPARHAGLRFGRMGTVSDDI